MILTQPVAREQTPVVTATPPRLHMLAVGKINGEERELQAAALYNPTDLIEHRAARMSDEKWVAEIRVNLRMTHRRIFQGKTAHRDAIAWCEIEAPHVRGMIDLPTLDNDEWAVLLDDQIDALPWQTADALMPAEMGAYDAEHGYPCDPLLHYAKLGDIEMYICGWKDAAAAMDETRDLAEDMADRDFWARGQW